MDKFMMICYVAADFPSRTGEVFSVRPKQIGTFIEAPVWVKETLMFKWLLADGSIKVAEENISMKQGENDPMEGIAASGKAEEVAEAVEEEIKEATEAVKEEAKEVAAPKKTRSKKAKKDDAE